jgi:outer membrane lipoprotein-sorting protein
MSKNIFFIPLMILVFETQVFSQTLDKIIDNYQSARGQSKFNELQTMIVKGEKVVIKVNIKSEYKEFIKFPGKFRLDIYMFNKIHTVLYNNGKGGIISPFSGSTGKENFTEISIDRIQSMEKSDIQGLLFNWQKKCKQVKYEGKTTLNKNELFKIRIITNSSDTLDYYIDTKNYLLQRVVYFPDFPDPTIATYSNYKNVKGMQLPFEIIQSNHGGSFSKETISQYIVNPEIADSLFEFK